MQIDKLETSNDNNINKNKNLKQGELELDHLRQLCFWKSAML